MSEKDTFEDNTAVLDKEYDDQEDEIKAMQEEDARIDELVEKIQEERASQEVSTIEAPKEEMPKEETPETPKEETNEAPKEDASSQEPTAEIPAVKFEGEEGQAAAILEGLLFVVGDEGLSLEQAAQTLDVSQERAAEIFDSLQKYYLEDSRGIEIVNYGGVYRFLTKAFVHDYAKVLFQMGKHSTLSQSALETLAIVAYKQPVTRVEIEEIRGVGCDMMLRKLQARDLIRESGRSEAPGRPILYEVTDEFMNSFKLVSLKELPELPKFGDSDIESQDLFNQ